MCGISGTFALAGELHPDIKRAIRPMTGALQHRGPDGEGFFSDARAALGHRRLAIIDREGGAQPMSNEDGTVWITFNGEIYNHRDVRTELVAKGHVFRTHSDTETIVHAYEEFGEGCVERLEGMFAFAVYDQRRGELFVVRDRLGKKPVYYAVLGGTLHFASENQSLRESPAWNGAVDLDAVEGYFSLGYFLAPRTIYRDVRELEAGHWLRVRSGVVEIRQYWDIRQFDDYGAPESDALAEVEALLEKCVRERLESEVPLGAFLSGGIDSGLVVSFMRDQGSARVITTSVGFGELAHNELDAAGLTAAAFGTDHHPHLIEPALDDVFDTLVDGFDQPFADASALPTYYVSQAARQHVTVALSGDGGDETFGGYDFRYVPHGVEARIRGHVPNVLQAPLRYVGASWPRWSGCPGRYAWGHTWRTSDGLVRTRTTSDLCFLKPGDARALLGLASGRDPRDSPVYEAVTGPYRRCRSTSAIHKAQYADLKVYLPNDVLTKVDRMSMQNSLEVRCPLLDRRLVELAFRLPERIKLPNLRAKHILKTIAARRLPRELGGLPKRGFTAPIGEWIAGRYAKRFESEVLSSRSQVGTMLDLRYLRRTFERHVAGHLNAGYLLWATWMFERWASRQQSFRAGQADSNTPTVAPAVA